MCGGHISSMKNGSKLVIQTTNLNFVKELFPGTNTQMLTLTASLNLIIFWKRFFLGTTQWCWPDCQCKSGFSERASSWKFTQWCWPDCQCSSPPPPPPPTPPTQTLSVTIQDFQKLSTFTHLFLTSQSLQAHWPTISPQSGSSLDTSCL